MAIVILVLLAAETDDEYLTVVRAPRQVAVEDSIGEYPQLSSQLAFEPRVDVMARNTPGAQGDIAIRGGIFEATGVRIGAVALFDPQTGHYLAELPIPPAMLSAPAVRVGWDNALYGFNATAGTLSYRWRPIETGARVAVDLAQGGDNHQHAYIARAWRLDDTVVAADVDVARAAGDGTRRDADHAFARVAARLQLRSAGSQTDLFAGYQDKFYGWPYLYAVRELHQRVGSRGAESDDMKTLLVAFNQRWADNRTTVELSGTFRDHRSDYEFDRAQPGRFNPFEHRTWTWGGGADLRHEVGNAAVLVSGQLLGDRIESTALTFGRFRTRTYAKLGLGAELGWALTRSWSLETRIGVAYDDSNRDPAHGSPMLELSVGDGVQRYTLQAARATQVPGYTAIASDPESGLFRGNPELGRERADNFEAGAHYTLGPVRLSLSVFHRRDYDLVDWTYASTSPLAARTANHLDIQTTGTEALVSGRVDRLRWVLGYTFLHKDEETDAGASFYALNYPKHRLTLALVFAPRPGVELRSDNELRDQAPNALRRGRTRVWLSALRLVIEPELIPGLSINVAVDNLLNLGFQEVPGVPGARRRVGAGLAVRF